MPEGIISAPPSIAFLVQDLQKASSNITTLMGELETQIRIVQSGSSGQTVEGFSNAALLWRNKGQGESDRTAMVAAKSEQFSQNMHQFDRKVASDFAI